MIFFFKNISQRRKLEKDRLLKIISTGFAFYEDQKGAKIGKCTSILEKLDDSDLTFMKRSSQQRRTKNKDQHLVTKCTITEGETSTFSCNTVASETVGESLLDAVSQQQRAVFETEQKSIERSCNGM